MTDTNDPGRGGLEESTIDLIVDHDAPRLHAEAEAIGRDAKPLIWVPDPADRRDHDAGSHRGLPIVPPSWAGNTTPGWAHADGPSPADPTPETGGRNHRKRRAIIAAITIVVILAAILTGLTVWQTCRVRNATAACESANTRITDTTRGLIKFTEADDYQTAIKVTAEQVEDPDTITALQAAIDGLNEQVRIGGDEEPAAPVIACAIDWTAPDPGRIADEAAGRADRLETRDAALKETVAAVISSREAKTLADATDALTAKKDQADALLKDSDGKVQDNATRDALGKAIDEAKALLDDGDDAKAMNDAVTSLDQAMNAVNESITAKQDADAQAAVEAAAAQAAQQPQQSYTPSYNNGYTGGGYYAPSYSGGSASSGGSTSTGSSGNSGNLDWLNHINDGGSACTADGYCPIG